VREARDSRWGRRGATARRICTALAGLLLAPLAAALPPSRVGIEFQINTFTPDYQSQAAVAIQSNGDFVVAWASLAQDGSGWGIFARRFAASGTPLAAEFQVNSYVTGDQTYPTAAMDGDGDFVVAWSSSFQDGSQQGVFARRFDSAGAALAFEFQVNSHTGLTQHRPTAAMEDGGGFVVAWSSSGQDGGGYGIFARRFDSAGVAQAAELQVNSRTELDQFDPAIAMDGDGDFVVVWEDFVGVETSNDIYARRFDASGTGLGAGFRVNHHTLDLQRTPTVAVSGGSFVVAWSSWNQDGWLYGIFAQRFNTAGAFLATEFQVTTRTLNFQRAPVAMMDGDGDFVVAWRGTEYNLSDGVYLRSFNAGGSGDEGETHANTVVILEQYGPHGAMNGAGRFVVVWRSNHQDGGGESGVFGQRFARFAMDVDGDGSVDPLTDGLLFLRYTFGFRGATLTAGAVGAGCTRCTAPAIEDFLDSVM
jgi:hypothetical protein